MTTDSRSRTARVALSATTLALVPFMAVGTAGAAHAQDDPSAAVVVNDVPWLASAPRHCPGAAFASDTFARPQVPLSIIDRDGDKMDDRWEDAWALNSNNPCDALRDGDRDGLTNLVEFRIQTIPYHWDSDNDGLGDGKEHRKYHTLPNSRDSDNDGLLDRGEIKRHHTNPREVDTDADGLTDGQEVYRFKTEPRNQDTDGDQVTDGHEVESHGTNPLSPDTDHDGRDDYTELFVDYTDPTTPNAAPVA